ncbi:MULTISPECIES: insulinase family protein [unclassified Sphingomonas]|uniref:M16 family metallopeptidase n=1 Tax=unclassified Sphingomonas TaxID=196159 RepID=UPI00226A6129|nr:MULTISPECIES: insulinase family protein [unclassified Sphingomonas]
MIGNRWPVALALALSATTVPVFAGSASDLVARAGAPVAAQSHWGRIVTGRLANGVRFAILPRRNNEPGIGLLMRNEGGFIAERRPGERGLAHLIEHIFFVSPTTGAPDDGRHFIHIGLPLTFPAPSAGTTSWRETNYFVSTRTTRDEDLNTLLGLLREGTTDLTFRPDAVNEQRADVMREMAGRKAGNDIYARYIAAVAPGSPTDVIDAQNSDDVPTASSEVIRELYHRLYRPRNMMIVIVGNVDPARVEALVRRHFGRWKATSPAPAEEPVPTFQADHIAPVSYSGASDGRRVAMITNTSALLPPAATRRGQAQAALMEALAMKAINNRLTDTRPDAAPGTVGVYVENGEQGHRLIMLWDNFKSGGWRPAVVGLRRISCDVEIEGFSEREWSRARQEVIRDLEQRTAGMAAVTNVELAKDLSHALAAGRDLIPPDELLRLARELLPAISARAGAAWWGRQRHAGVEQVRVEAPELAQLTNAPEDIRNTADKAVSAQACELRKS